MERTHRMTTTHFGAPAPNTRAQHYTRPAHASHGALGFRLTRLVWLTARFARRELVSIAAYRRRFGVPMETFHREVRTLRRAARYLDAFLHGNYRQYFYLEDRDLE